VDRRASSQVLTLAPDGTDPRWLGQLGHVAGLQYGSTCPGGDDQLSCTLQIPPSARSPALNPGRMVKVFRGASRVWYGQLNEPVPSASGWAIQAHGVATMASQFAAYYTSWNLNNPVDQAILRGLPWINPGIAGGWLSQQPDNASQTVADHLNMVCGKSGQVWQVDRWNRLQVGAIPSVVNRLLVATSPVARSIANDITTVWLKYTASDDGSGNDTYNLTDSFNQADINRHGPTEVYADLSNAGVMSAGAAQAVGASTLARFQRASFQGPFTIRYGQYLTTGGTPVDLGCERAGAVARLLVTDAPFGGEQSVGLIQFPVGAYAYDDDSGTAQVTPLNSSRADFAALLALIAPATSS
jgi:hypothetical protein